MNVNSTPRGHLKTIIGLCAALAALLGGAMVVTNAQGPPPGGPGGLGAGPGGGGFGGGPGGGQGREGRMDAMAKDMGVTSDKLKAAIAMSRPAQRPPGPMSDAERVAFRQKLAITLGVPLAKVNTVMDKYRRPHGFGGGPGMGSPGGPGGRGPGGLGGPQSEERQKRAAAIAKDLGTTPAKLMAAVQKYRLTNTGQRPTEAQRAAEHAKIAKAIGVSTAKFEKVLAKYRPALGQGGPPPPGRFGGGPDGPPQNGGHPQLF